MGWTQRMDGSEQGTQHGAIVKKIHKHTHQAGRRRNDGARKDSSLAGSSLSSSPRPSAAGARGSHTWISQDS